MKFEKIYDLLESKGLLIDYIEILDQKYQEAKEGYLKTYYKEKVDYLLGKL